jgi:hypothetical protein
MKKLRNSELGFGAIETILILVIIVAIVGVGWYVWKAKKNTDSTYNIVADTSTTIKPIVKPKTTITPATDPTANWTKYSNKSGEFSFRYPTTWVQATSPELCTDGLVLLGPDSSSVGKCASDGFGEIYALSTSGDQRSQYELGSSYVGLVRKTVTVSGVTGARESGVAQGQQNGAGEGGLPDGTKVVLYIFYTNSKTYVIGYNQASTNPDVMTDFDLMVTNSFKFTG